MSHKYARTEVERRWLLAGLPDDLDLRTFTSIRDCYVEGTRLRLRLMTNVEGEVVGRKLGQKYVDGSRGPHAAVMTNLYLDVDEYDVLAKLPGLQLDKRRYSYPHGGQVYSVDQFGGALDGLLLAELEQRPDEPDIMLLPAPVFARREVTKDARFGGGALVQMSRAEFVDWRQRGFA